MKRKNMFKTLVTFFLVLSITFSLILSDMSVMGTGYILVSADDNVIGVEVEDPDKEPDDIEVIVEDELTEPIRVIITFEDNYDYNHETTISWEGTGYGTIDDPYLISTAEDLVRLRDNVNAGCSYYGRYFKLTNSIDLNGSYPDENNKNWIPIGYFDDNDKAESYRFDGCFDGNGYTIKNVYISSDRNSLGLFGYVTGEIKNLEVWGNVNCKTVLDYKYAGGIVGVLLKEETEYNQNIDSGSIRNCTFKGNISAGQYTGGIAGFHVGEINNCLVEGSITGYGEVGGIAGHMKGNVCKCTNRAGVTNTGVTGYCGGIIGHGEKGEIDNCVNTGKVDNGGMDYTGGIIGAYVGVHFSDEREQALWSMKSIERDDPGMIKNCTNKGEISGKNNTAGIAGYIAWCNVSNCVNSGNLNESKSNNRGGIIGITYMVPYIEYCTNNGKIYGNRYVGGIVGYQDGSYPNPPGPGMQSNPELGVITQCINNGEIHGDSICFAGIAGRCASNNEISFCTNTANIMYFDDTSKSVKRDIGGIVGLFEKGLSGGSIISCINSGDIDINKAWRAGGIAGRSEVKILECTNSGNIKVNSNAGGICGEASGSKIEKCYNSGGVETDKYKVGGIIGFGNLSYVAKCRNTGAVTGTGFVGGIAGLMLNQSDGGKSISDCINSGDIASNGYAEYWTTDTDQAYAGGIAGAVWGMNIERCANKGNVKASGTCVGGIAGQLTVAGSVSKDNKTSSNISINVSDSYNIGGISGKNNVGGLIGYIASYPQKLKMKHCYNYGSIDSDGSDWGKLVGEAQNHDSDYEDNVFTDDNWNPMGWDTLNVYSGYHYLKNKNMTDFSKFTGYGFSEDVWTMGSSYPTLKMEKEDWAKTSPGAGGVGGTGGKGGYGAVLLIIKSKEDLKSIKANVDNGATYEGLMVSLESDIDLSGENWEPIGADNAFLGYFNGNGHSITGLNIDSDADRVGLFGRLGWPASLYNLYVSGNVKGSGSSVGGLVGLNGGSIDCCFFEGDVTGTGSSSNVGGIAGASGDDWSGIANCGHAGTVMSAGSFVGGIIGYIVGRPSVRHCFHYGDSSTVLAKNGEETGGGIVGMNIGNHRFVTNCFCLSGMDIIGKNGPAPRDNRTLESLEDFKDPTKTAYWTLDFDISSEPGATWGYGSLYPCLQVISDPVKLMANNGKGEVKTYYVHRNSTMMVPDCTFTNDGYKFAGWNSELDGTGISYDNNGVIHGGEVLYAQWEEDTFTVKYDPTYIYNESPVMRETTYTISSEETLPVYRMKWYRLVGWRANLVGLNATWEHDKIYRPGTPLKGNYGNVWFDAIWEEDPTATPDTCTVRFSVDIWEGDPVVYDYGTPASEIVIPDFPDIVNEFGYTLTLDKWYPEIGDVTDDVRYWSQYVLKIETVTYDANGGIGYMEPTEVCYDKIYWLSKNKYTRRGYTFTGWNTVSDGSGDSYSDGSAVCLTEDITLYAQWSPNAIYMLDIADASYTGSPICPEVTVKDGEETLVFDTDYTIEYTDNVSAGTAKVLITGKGDYADRAVTGSFAIFSIDSTTPGAPQAESKTATCITLFATEGYQYKCNDGEWQDSNVFTGLEPDTEYLFYQRNKGDINHNVSDSSAGTVIATEVEVVSTETPAQTGDETETPTQTEETTETPTSTGEVTETPETITPTGESAETTENLTPTGEATETPETITPTGESAETTETSTPIGEATETPETITPTGESTETPETITPTGEATETPETITPTGESAETTETSTPTEEATETTETITPTGESAETTETSTPTEGPAETTETSTSTGGAAETPVISTPSSLQITEADTVTNSDGSKTTTTRTWNEEGNCSELVVREQENGNRNTKEIITDTETGKTLYTKEESIRFSSKGNETIWTDINNSDGYRLKSTEKIYTSGKKTLSSNEMLPDKSKQDIKETKKADGTLIRKVMDTDTAGNSCLTIIEERPVSAVDGTSGDDAANNSDTSGNNGGSDNNGTDSSEFQISRTEIVYTIGEDKTASLISLKTDADTVTIPKSVSFNGTTYKVDSIADKAFYKNKTITTVIIGKNIKNIGEKAFYKASKLKNIYIYSKQIEKVGDKAFYGISKKAVFSIKAKKSVCKKTAGLIQDSGYKGKVNYEKTIA